MHMQKTFLKFGGSLCRRCFDRYYKVHLSHRDVRETEGVCSACGKEGRIVTGLKLGGRIKMLWKW